MGHPVSQFELQPVPVDNTRIDKLESTVNEQLNLIQHRLDIMVDLMNKTRQLDRERNTF